MGYSILSNGTVKYSEVVSTTLEKTIEDSITITSETTVENAENRLLRLRVRASVDKNAGTIVKTGIIACRGETVPEAGLTIESAAANSNIADISLDGTSVSTTAKDTKGGVHYVGYAILESGMVKYGEVVSTTFEKVSQLS